MHVLLRGLTSGAVSAPNRMLGNARPSRAQPSKQAIPDVSRTHPSKQATPQVSLGVCEVEVSSLRPDSLSRTHWHVHCLKAAHRTYGSS